MSCNIVKEATPVGVVFLLCEPPHSNPTLETWVRTSEPHSPCASLDTLAPSAPCFIGHRSKKQLLTVFSSLTGSGAPKNPECESVQDFYFLPLHSSLFTKIRIRDFLKVIGNR